MNSIPLDPIYQVLIYTLGIILSILVSKLVGGSWLPRNKFSFRPSAIFPAPVLTTGILALFLEFFSLQFSVYIMISIALGVVIGTITMLYLKITYPT